MKSIINLSFLFVVFLGCTVVDTELLELVLEIKNQNQELLDEVKSLQAKSDSLINELKSSAAKQEELLMKVTELQTELAKVLTQIGALTEKLDSQEVDLEAIKAELADLQEKYQGILEQLEQLQQLSQILAEIETLKGQITELDGKYQVILGSLAQNEEQLLALKNQIEALQTQLQENLNKISELTSMLGEQGADIEKILAAIEELKASCAEIKSLLENQLSGKSPIPTNGLVGWWPFNGNANDESGNGFNGTINAATLTTNRSGVPNSAYSFNGTNGYILVNGNQKFVSAEMTISAWVLFNQMRSDGLQYLVLGNNTNAAWSLAYSATNYSNNFRRNQGCGLRDNFWPVYYGPNNWYHVVYVISDNTISSYLDGNFLSSQPTSTFQSNCSSYTLNIGLDVIGDREFLNGKLDDIAIWDRALTAEEVSKIYKGEGF